MSKCTVMKYYGSKRRMTEIINSIMPDDYKVWIEGCMGSGAVSLNRDCPRGCKVNIANEKGRGIYTFWKVLADKEKGLELMDRISMCDGSRQTFEEAHWNVTYIRNGMSDVEYAKNVYLDVALSYGVTRRDYGKQPRERDFKRAVKEHMRPAYERFQREGTKILNWDVVDLLKEIGCQPRHVQKNIMIYLDPPYLFSLRSAEARDIYEEEMPIEKHLEMLGLLQRTGCKVILSGYLNKGMDTYCEKLLPYGYKCYFIGKYRKTCTSKKIEDGEEHIWCNYEFSSEKAIPVNYQSKLVWTP